MSQVVDVLEFEEFIQFAGIGSFFGLTYEETIPFLTHILGVHSNLNLEEKKAKLFYLIKTYKDKNPKVMEIYEKAKEKTKIKFI